jgi:hypothetical protein
MAIVEYKEEKSKRKRGRKRWCYRDERQAAGDPSLRIATAQPLAGWDSDDSLSSDCDERAGQETVTVRRRNLIVWGTELTDSERDFWHMGTCVLETAVCSRGFC